MRLQIPVLAILSIFQIAAPTLTAASDGMASSSSTSSGPSRHRSRRHKPTSRDAAMQSNLGISSGTASSNEGRATGLTQMPSVSNTLGGPNLGSADHVPGTSGTSGQ